ncbi:MAG TPA: cell division protein ZipA [Pinirhizobacter sp.]|uniref:cell division protein ZipA n=1 Tax=Pinirhizobacter sp. TaxID=2950432 RepID=UPI002D041375|nr:cell division protein ZipA [Pinirhizobacter sp.]HMH68361.1 cell division protein ZipA [Pinirhizobacter sp.]
MTHEPVVALAWNPAIGVPLLIVAVIVLGLIWLFGQPRKEQGRRKPQPPAPQRAPERREPTFGDEPAGAADNAFDFPPPNSRAPRQGTLDMDMQDELERLGATLAGDRSAPVVSSASIEDILRSPLPTEPTASTMGAVRPSAPPARRTEPAPAAGADTPPFDPASPGPAPSRATPAIEPVRAAAAAPSEPPPRSDVGRRPVERPVERIVSLYVVSRDDHVFNGTDLVVAAEKAGLEFGDMGIFHRLVDGRRELGPIFSVANLVKPGSFDLKRVEAMQTPGLSFFMTLPGPVPALDAWDTMLPAAQRLAELLDGLVLDEERNALGRQRIAHIRDELRGWDRGHEGVEIKFGA